LAHITGKGTARITFRSNEKQNEDILVLANPGPPGKWLLNGERSGNYRFKNFIYELINMIPAGHIGSSGSMPDCSVRGPGIESCCTLWAVVFIVETTVIYSLGYGLCAPFLQCLGQLSLCGMVNEYQLSG